MFLAVELGKVKGMNREIRRMQEKADQKPNVVPRKRGPKKVPKSTKPKNTLPKRTKASKDDAKAESKASKEAAKGSKRRGRLPNNRFTGILGLLTAFFVVMQSASRELVDNLNNNASTVDYVFHGLSFLLFGYFVNLWLSRRGSVNALAICAIFGGALLAGVEIGKWFNFSLAPNPILIAIAIVGLISGIVLARVVFKMSERYAT